MDTTGFIKERVGLFKDFSAERIQKLVDGSLVRSFETNEAIAHQGAEASPFGVVLSGTLAASAVTNGSRQPLGQLKAGDTFAEAALMTGNPLLADFIAESHCEVLLIPVSLFQSIIVAEPGAVRHISRTIADRTKMLVADPAKTKAALQQGNDPYGLTLKGERPEKILVINVGSSSLKYSFYDTADESRHAKGLVERIGLNGTRLKHRGPKGELKRDLEKGDHAAAFKTMVAELTSKETGVIKSAAEVSLVAHRVVHGGEKFTEGTLLSDDLLTEMEKLNPLAPLHNPVIIAGIREMRRLFPAVPHVGVFDTAFHHTLPPYAFLYGLPYEFYEKKAVRRYGFHGTSHN
ncbi:MAG: cyclic nucleotide-binding domain-containing protein, partial [Candidatus Binatia bacterium]